MFKANFLNANVQPFPFNGSFNEEVDYANPAFIKRENGDIALPTQIQQTDLTKANLKGADLSEANLTGTQLPISNPFTNLLKKFTNIRERYKKTAQPNSDDAKAKMIEESESTTNLAEAEPTLPTDISSIDQNTDTNSDQNSQEDKPETDPEQGDEGTPVNKLKIPNKPNSDGGMEVESEASESSDRGPEKTNNSADLVTDTKPPQARISLSELLDDGSNSELKAETTTAIQKKVDEGTVKTEWLRDAHIPVNGQEVAAVPHQQSLKPSSTARIENLGLKQKRATQQEAVSG